MSFHTYPAVTTVCRMLHTLTLQKYDHLSTPHHRGESVEPAVYAANPPLCMFHK